MKQRLLRVAGLKFYLNPSRIVSFPFLRFHRIKKRKVSSPVQNLRPLPKFLARQTVRANYDYNTLLGCIRRTELISQGFLTGTFRRLHLKDPSLYPVFLVRHTMFISLDSLQAESYALNPSWNKSMVWGTYLSSLLAGSGGLLLHAAAVVKDGFAYIFLGADGAGKTTVTNLSKEYLVLHDDKIVVRKQGRKFLAFASFRPKEGKFGYSCHKKGFPIKAVFFIKKSKKVSFSSLPKHKALYFILLPVNYIHYFDFLPDRLTRQAFFTAHKLIKSTPCFTMNFSKRRNFWPELERAIKKTGTA